MHICDDVEKLCFSGWSSWPTLDIQCVSVDSVSLIIYPEIKATELMFQLFFYYYFLCNDAAVLALWYSTTGLTTRDGSSVIIWGPVIPPSEPGFPQLLYSRLMNESMAGVWIQETLSQPRCVTWFPYHMVRIALFSILFRSCCSKLLLIHILQHYSCLLYTSPSPRD